MRGWITYKRFLSVTVQRLSGLQLLNYTQENIAKEKGGRMKIQKVEVSALFFSDNFVAGNVLGDKYKVKILGGIDRDMNLITVQFDRTKEVVEFYFSDRKEIAWTTPIKFQKTIQEGGESD